jgi:hypothetical protein
MRVIYFTEGATDWLNGFRAQRARSVPLASGGGKTDLGCLHLMPGARIIDPPGTHDCALPVSYGQVLVLEGQGGTVNLPCGMGAVITANVRYRLESERGAIVLTMESHRLEATAQGISTHRPESLANAGRGRISNRSRPASSYGDPPSTSV